MPLPRCLHLEDEPLTSRLVATRLNGTVEVRSVRSVSDALLALKESALAFDVLVVDIEIANSSMSGADFIRFVRGTTNEPMSKEPSFVRHRKTPIVVLTGSPTPALQAAAKTWGVTAILTKPLNFGALERALKESIAAAKG